MFILCCCNVYDLFLFSQSRLNQEKFSEKKKSKNEKKMRGEKLILREEEAKKVTIFFSQIVWLLRLDVDVDDE